MRKFFIITALTVFGFTQISAQEGNFKVGAFFGLPMADASDTHSFNVGLDVAYLFDIADSFQVGPATGYSHSFGKTETVSAGIFTMEIDYEDMQFIPLAAAARFNLDTFYFGADLGYAIGINDGNKGGVYYRPKVGYNFGPLAAFISYTGVSVKSEVTVGEGPFQVTAEGTSTFGSINAGVEFSF